MRFARNVFFAVVLATFPGAGARADAYDPPANYYNSATGTGATLKGQLASIMTTGHIQRTYGDFRESAAITDADPARPGNILLMYTRASVPGAWDPGVEFWNREHVWPVSRQPGGDVSNGTSGNKGDPHSLRPADADINNTRANSPFGLDATTGSHRYVDGTYYYPGDADAGDTARSLFYSATRYGSVGLALTDGSPGSNQMSDLSSLVAWHYRDVPDEFERRRNQAIYSQSLNPQYYTNNRNAYVDRPEFVWSVFVDQQNDTQLTIAGATPDASGGSLGVVDLGRVLVGAPAPGPQSVAIAKGGVDGAYYSVTTAGAATSSLTGRYNAFALGAQPNRMLQAGLTTSTATAGLKSGSITIDNLDVTTAGGAGRGANDANDIVTVNLNVLDHANPSFNGVADANELTFDFGIVTLGAPAPVFSFDLFNLPTTDGFTAGLDLDGILGSGDVAALTTNLTPFAGVSTLAAGASRSFQATLDTGSAGSFSASFALSFSDENLPGAAALGSMTLNLSGTVEAAPIISADFDGSGDIDGHDFLAWQLGVGTTEGATRSQGDANGDGDVDADDLVVWTAAFDPPPHLTAVPEPAGCLQILIAAAASAVLLQRVSWSSSRKGG